MSDAPQPHEYPEPLQEAFDQLGPPTEEFKGSVSTAVVAMFLGVLGLIAGIGGTIFMIFYIIDRGFNDKVLRALPIPIVGIAGWYSLRTGIRNRFVRMYMCDRGFVHQTAKAVVVYPWNEIEGIVQDRVKDGVDENGIPFMNRSTTFLIKRQDGCHLGVDVNVLKKPLTFARLLYKVTRPHNIQWTVQ